MPAKKPLVKTLVKKIKKLIKFPEDAPIGDEDVWAAVNSFFEENGLVQAQLAAFNDFIYHKSHKVIDQLSHITIEEDDKKYEIEFSNLVFLSPCFIETDDSTHSLMPIEALWRNITYFSQMLIDVTVTPPSGEPSFYEKIHLGNMPVMVRSDLCNVASLAHDREALAAASEDILDHGGYFVITPKGEGSGVAQRRVLVPQERAAPNKVFVFHSRKKKPKYETYAEIRSCGSTIHTTIATVGSIGNVISCILPWIDSSDIPLGVVFRALGVKDEREMAEMCLGPEYEDDLEALEILVPTFEYSYECDSQIAALHFIGRRGRKFGALAAVETEAEGAAEDDGASATLEEINNKSDAISYAKHLLAVEFLPHCGTGEDTYHKKAIFLGHITRALLNVSLGREIPESRDHYMNKRIISVDMLLTQQFYGAMRRLVTEITNNTRNALRKGNTVNITGWIKPSIMTNAMQGAISNNAWHTGGDASKGISQLYEQFNYTASIANLRKVTTPMAAEGGKNIEPRDLHEGQWMAMCLSETPEGKKAGLVKNLAMAAYLTFGTDPLPVQAILMDLLESEDDTIESTTPKTKIFLNGNLLGESIAPEVIVKEIVDARRVCKISRETSVAHFDRATKSEVYISTEGGRLCRPLFVVVANKILFDRKIISELQAGEMTWTQLLTTGTVELIDKTEEETMKIAHYPSDLLLPNTGAPFTHCEMHPSLMLGIGGSIIPFPDHNQCIWAEEKVVMADGTRKKIKDVKVDDIVVNFDPTTHVLGAARVTHALTKLTNKQMYCITTEAGQITATYDHRFLTDRGWKMLIDIIQLPATVGLEFRVGIFYAQKSPYRNITKFVKIQRWYPVPLQQISDITTDSPYQNFICNGFGVHNSPRNTYQCLWKEEPVLMGDGSWKAIKDVKIGDEVKTFDPNNLGISTTKVVHAHTTQTEKMMLKISTRKHTIVVTEDHKILSFLGWTAAGKLKRGDSIFVYQRVAKSIILDPITSISQYPNVEISDITTESKNHSFIGGTGICVHNSAMGKQAIGIPFTNYRQIMSGTFHTLMYLQKPLALSRAASIIGFDEMPAGLNAIVAIMPRPFNEEDSEEICQDSIDRGFMVGFKWNCYYMEMNEEKGEEFGIPSEELCNKFRGNPGTLGPEGFALPGTELKTGDMIIGKMSRKSDTDANAPTNKKELTNASAIYDPVWPAVVDQVQTGTTGEGYKYIRVMTAQKREPVIGDKFCYSPDHEVLTSKGWVPIAEVRMDHSVATLSESGKLEYQHPTEIMDFPHTGQMVEVDNNQVSLLVTPEHNMYVKTRAIQTYKLVEAKKLFNKEVYYKKDAVWETEGLKEFVLPAHWHSGRDKQKATLYPKRRLPIEAWLQFFGIWMAEGCTVKGRILIAVNKERVLAVLEEILKEMGFEYIVRPNAILDISEKQIAAYMTPFSVGAINKKLPDWVWELNREQSIILLESMCLGDGHMNGKTPMYDTSSIHLKDDVMRLALHCGWAANACIKSPKGTHKVIRGSDSVTNADAWRLTIIKTQLNPAVNKHIKNQQKYIPYDGQVYCITVPNHVIYVRRVNGGPRKLQKPIWCGQSFRHGQKGVIGFKPRALDLPFTSQGINPDIIMNSLALPSRMTIAMLIEILAGKAVTSSSLLHGVTVKELKLGGDLEPLPDMETHISAEFSAKYAHPTDRNIVDATPCRKSFDLQTIVNEMKKYGLEYGDEAMYDGITGLPLRCLVFMGPAYSQKLKHMVIDKKHARARGGRTALVRQPNEGRAAGGGLRIGVMERDCILGQGAARFARDRLMEQSDEYRQWVCGLCGLPAFVEQAGAIKECRVCGTNKVEKIRIPYGTKLVSQELMAMNIVPRAITTGYDREGDQPGADE